MVFSFCIKRIILSRNSFLKVPKRNGYIVLLPEIGEDLPQKNPLLKDDMTPEFNKITIEKCTAVIAKQAIEFEEGVKNIEIQVKDKEKPDVFTDVLFQIEDMHMPLEITWGIAKVLYYGNQSLMPTKHYRNIHQHASKALASRFTNTFVYQFCKNAKEDKEFSKLGDEEKRLLSKYILEGKLNGIELTGNKIKYFHRCVVDIHSKINEFTDKIELSTKQFSLMVKDPVLVRDFPENLLKATAPDPEQPHVGPWKITLKPHVFQSFMEHCPDRVLRWKVWEANVSRGSMHGDRQFQTSSVIDAIQSKRNEQAEYLGFKSYAHMSMETKMVESLEELNNTLQTLLQIARPAQERELAELTEFAQQRGMEGPLKPWDIPYWSRKQRFTIYKYQEDTFKNYFPLPKVLAGLFKVLEKYFGIQILESRKVDVWHKDILFYDVFDMDGSNTEPIANFYLDPYIRQDDKILLDQDSGYVVTIKNRSKICNTKPMCALIFNFERPNDGKPSLLSFADLQLLFQKFGHALHQMLTKVNYAEISGLSSVEWDATFISDFFFANWLYDPQILKEVSSHYDTKASLPMEMIKILKNMQLHLAGYNMCMELFLSRLDLEFHSSKEFWASIMERLWKEHFIIPYEKKDARLCSFSPIFSGNWAAAYYSHLWSKMIAADVCSAFQEVPSTDQTAYKDTAKRYRDTFLSLGGLYPANETFRKFRGRDPSPKALLNYFGLVSVKKEQ